MRQKILIQHKFYEFIIKQKPTYYYKIPPLFYWLLDFKIHSDTKNFFKNAQKIIKEKTEKNVIKKPTEKLPKNK